MSKQADSLHDRSLYHIGEKGIKTVCPSAVPAEKLFFKAGRQTAVLFYVKRHLIAGMLVRRIAEQRRCIKVRLVQGNGKRRCQI